MLGDLKKDFSFTTDGAGIIPNCVRDLIYTLDRQRSSSSDLSGSKTVVSVSYFEVYNEQVYDLLDSCGQCLSVREDQEKGIVIVAGATEIVVESVDQVMQLLCRGSKNRKTEATMANQVSSRSHAVFQMIVTTTKYSERGQAYVTTSKLSLIDLAGSERASATNNRGIRLVEGANINKSLLALANCINALSENSHHMNTRRTNVKYRDSKLTHLLKSSLEGNCYLVMIANVNPSDCTYEDSHNTLKYANRAKSIKVNPEVRETLKRSDFLERENRLRDENTLLRNRVEELEKIVDELQSKVLQYESVAASIDSQKITFDNVYSEQEESISLLPNPIRMSKKRSLSQYEDENLPPNIHLSNSPKEIYEEHLRSKRLSPIKKSRPSIEIAEIQPGKHYFIILDAHTHFSCNLLVRPDKRFATSKEKSPMVSRSLSPMRSKPQAKRQSKIPRPQGRKHPTRSVSPMRNASPTRNYESGDQPKLSPYGRSLFGV
jgi:hypothetical protein